QNIPWSLGRAACELGWANLGYAGPVGGDTGAGTVPGAALIIPCRITREECNRGPESCPFVREVEDQPGNIVQRRHMGSPPGVDRLLGHPEYHAGSFVLGDGFGPGLPHLLEPRGAVGAHAGEDGANRVRPGVAGHGFEQYVHRRTMAGYQGARPDRLLVPVS